MLSWIILVFLLPTTISALGHPKYECGEHGRFEYCIDGIPGCIVGCHCHPGYYFDTETKICEPNAKLVHDYRRLYSGEPTWVPYKAYSLDTEMNTTPATTLPPESQVDNIGKNADDLGDWLYNQFFKAIESQVVINKTVSEKPPTRRDGSKPRNFSEPINKNLQKKSSRRKAGKSRKKFKVRGRKEKKKNQDFRRKMLRISEDDSLFDSSRSDDTSTDTSDESDSSDTSDSEGTSDDNNGAGAGGGSEGRGLKHSEKYREQHHGHRKILVVNKKPKPPLPSFIFLPQYDTPFYPPIGLPPPIMPMYPMVPVPPMPPYPYPVPECSTTPNDKTEATTKHDETDATEKPDDTTADKQDDKTTVYPDDVTTTNDETTEDVTLNPSLLRRNLKKHKNMRAGSNHPEENKKKKKHKKKAITSLIPDPFMDTFSPPDFATKDFDIDNIITKPMPEPVPGDDEPGPGGSDVDFKYLAQLIHKMGPNNTEKTDDEKFVTAPPHMRRNLNELQTHAKNENYRTRKNFDRQGRNLKNVDDLYYSKLGHQIASLIRNLDDTNGRRLESVPTPVPVSVLGPVPISVPNLFFRGPSISNQGLNQGLNQVLYNNLVQARNQGLKQGPNENINQALIQSLNQNLNQPLNQVLSQGLNQGLNQVLNQNLSQPPNQTPNQDLNQNLNMPLNQGLSQGLNQVLNQGTNQGQNQDFTQGINNALHQGSSLLSQDLRLAPSLNPYLYQLQQIASTSPEPIPYENYAPHTYWERSVRSLFDDFHRYPVTLDPKTDNLYKLESRLILVASTERPLSLTEIENILTIMANAKTQLQKHTNNMLANDTGNENFNVNLLPRHMELLAKNGNAFHGSANTNPLIITKENHLSSDEITYNEDDITNSNIFSKQKFSSDFVDTRNLKEFPNKYNADPTKTKMTHANPNRKQLARNNITRKKQFNNEYVNYNASPRTKAKTSFSVLNFAPYTKKMEKNLNNIEHRKKKLELFNFIPNLKDVVNVPKNEKKNFQANKGHEQRVSPSMMNNARRNLQGVLYNNFKNIPNLAYLPKVEITRYNNNTHINLKDILKLQRYTTTKIKEITGAHNHLTWWTPNVAQFIPNADKTFFQPDLHLNKVGVTNNRRVFMDKPVRFHLPERTPMFRSGPHAYFDKDETYVNHQMSIFE